LSRKSPNCAWHRANQHGFTLIEVLVALAIMALGMGALIAAASTGLGNTRAAQQYIEAVRRAQSHLATVGITIPLSPGVKSGDDGQGYTWRISISAPQSHIGPPAQGQPRLGLYAIEATVSWRANALTRSVTLQSRRLGANG
jgi:general secretion pathway protein I